MHGRLALFNPADLSLRRTTVQKAREPIELLCVADAVDLHSSVVFIPDPPTHAYRVRSVLNEPAEPDALYSSGDEPGTRFQSPPRHVRPRKTPKRPPPGSR